MSETREDFAADLSERLGGLSVRQLATVSGWGRTTVADVRAGRQFRTADQLRDLLMSVGADEEELAQWEARRLALVPPTPAATPSPASPDTEPDPDATSTHRRRWLRPALITLVAGLLLAIGFGSGYAVRDRTLRHAVPQAANTTGPVSAARSEIVEIAQGAQHTCALTGGGAVWCWGRDDVGQLGDGRHTTSSRPLQVTGLLAGMKRIAAGGRTSCAVSFNDSLRCWGHHAFGQLGNGKEVHSPVPVGVAGLPGPVAAVAVGGLHVCALTRGGDAYCWGNGEKGQLGIGRMVRAAHEPVLVEGIPVTLAGITAGADFTCAWSIRREVYCWGANSDGQLGIGTREDSLTPVRLKAYPQGVAMISAGGTHACAIAPAGGVDCWGRGADGRLGTGSTEGSSVPVPVKGLDKGIITLATAAEHSCAGSASGGVWCWGSGTAGELGAGLNTSSATPLRVPGLTSGGRQLTAGDESTCALDSEALWCWGASRYGEVGAGSALNLVKPHRLSLP